MSSTIHQPSLSKNLLLSSYYVPIKNERFSFKITIIQVLREKIKGEKRG